MLPARLQAALRVNVEYASESGDGFFNRRFGPLRRLRIARALAQLDLTSTTRDGQPNYTEEERNTAFLYYLKYGIRPDRRARERELAERRRRARARALRRRRLQEVETRCLCTSFSAVGNLYKKILNVHKVDALATMCNGLNISDEPEAKEDVEKNDVEKTDVEETDVEEKDVEKTDEPTSNLNAQLSQLVLDEKKTMQE